MLFHPHLHVLILGGGIDEKGFWIYSSKKLFIPVKVLGKLEFEADIKAFRIKLYKKKWYVYCKKTFNGPEAVLNLFVGIYGMFYPRDS